MRNAVKTQFKGIPTQKKKRKEKIGTNKEKNKKTTRNLVKNLYASQRFLTKTQKPQVDGERCINKGKIIKP